MTDLESILVRLGLSQYLDQLVAEGFETWETVLDITEADLVALQVKRGHRRILQREIASARGLSVDQGLPSPRRNTPSDDKGPDADEPPGSPKGDNETRELLRGQNLSFTEIAKLVGEKWQVLPAVEKEPFETQAAAAKERYNTELSEYKRTDSYRDYTQYLADFKAKYSTQPSDGKRAKLETQPSTASSNSLTGASTSPRPATTARTSGDSIPSSINRSTSAGYQTASLPSPNSLPTAQAGFTPTMAGPSLSHGFGSHHTSPKPASSGGYSRNMNVAALEDLRDAHPGPSMEPLPRIIPLDDQRLRSGQTSLPPLNVDEMGGTDQGLLRLSNRRSDRLSTSLTREGTTASSTSSGSTLGSGTSGSSNPYDPRTPSDVFPYQRNLTTPQSGPLKGDLIKDNASAARHLHSLLPGSGPLPPVPYHTLPPPGERAVRGGPGISTLSTHDSQEMSAGVRPRGPEQYGDAQTGSHGVPARNVRDGPTGSPTGQMSDVRATSPFSALLMAGESMAAREDRSDPA
ncbi:MAG: hypothetical protein M1838_001567 [Thelocarpon superellum]|nr:MAG: hypothetical protein M1838_001567 [Thelocarpon superellum]